MDAVRDLGPTVAARLACHVELLFAFTVPRQERAQYASSVAKYMVKRRGPPSQGWRIFLRNHAPDIAAMDLFIAPTIGFDRLYAVRLDRGDLVWINVTATRRQNGLRVK